MRLCRQEEALPARRLVRTEVQSWRREVPAQAEGAAVVYCVLSRAWRVKSHIPAYGYTLSEYSCVRM